MSKYINATWKAEKSKGWGGDYCIVDSNEEIIFKAVKPKAYYTDYAPGKEPGSVILSSKLAESQGRYVATDEIRAHLDEIEMNRAELIAESPNLLAALKGIINATNSVSYGKAYEKARELVAKIEGEM